MKTGVIIKSSEEIDGMRRACRIAAEILDAAGSIVKVGVTTNEIDQFIHDLTLSKGAFPSTLHYHGYPKSCCTSINEVICHGIPEDRKLKDGDIINVDVTAYLDGFHGDTSKMFAVGSVDPKAIKLIETTLECLNRGIEAVNPKNRLGDVGYAIQSLAESRGYSIVREFCGHGIGRNFHEEPHVLHYGRPGQGIRLREGMIFTIEPMLNIGEPDARVLSDNWTAVTVDGSLSAQFEHTILVTRDGCEILTLLS